MDLDNSGAQIFWTCPAKYQERYVNKIEPYIESTALSFGTRMHQLLEYHFKEQADCDSEDIGTPLQDTVLESEAGVMFESYRAQYPVEEFKIIEVERLIKVPLIWRETHREPEHFYVAKLDLVGRYTSGPASGHLFIMDHKTEPRNSRGNDPIAWKHKSQVGLYQWAAEQVYGEPVYNIIIDILTRQSPAGRIPPSFRRIPCQRTKWQCEQAAENLRYVAHQIEELQDREDLWPQNRSECRWCPYEIIHGEAGREESLVQVKFKEAEDYLKVHDA